MNRKIAAGLTALTIAGCIIGGCKKEEEHKPAETTPAPATTTAPAAPAGTATQAQGKSGEALFKERCASCHPDGGNTMNAKKTLHSADLKANNMTKAEDIVAFMRNPSGGMPKFDATTVPDADATAIAEYILKTFK
ncbi:c-type cytochrome [Geomonas sp. RF6]|uniref:c-type cytochrome n=1 Tax=Geomonas sp. RF6 TaxID=2897342 RepID=UPI001E29F5D0|nr:c-type cytochrome [Geomonas sp. RF6]UFS71954.1 c-type cytochrome [Geomonas sp. RF6]